MNAQELIHTARALVAESKGLLAMDESTPTCNKRFEKVGIPQTEETRRFYRELIVTTPGLGEFISGVILYDETIRQSRKDGTPFVKVITDAGIIPGIKVDTGAHDMAAHPGEKITEGLDGLRDRLAEYSQMGDRSYLREHLRKRVGTYAPESANTQVVSTPMSGEHHDGHMLQVPTFINNVVNKSFTTSLFLNPERSAASSTPSPLHTSPAKEAKSHIFEVNLKVSFALCSAPAMTSFTNSLPPNMRSYKKPYFQSVSLSCQSRFTLTTIITMDRERHAPAKKIDNTCPDLYISLTISAIFLVL
jgi:hypothetical protein